jgi:hypothetical protein
MIAAGKKATKKTANKCLLISTECDRYIHYVPKPDEIELQSSNSFGLEKSNFRFRYWRVTSHFIIEKLQSSNSFGLEKSNSKASTLSASRKAISVSDEHWTPKQQLFRPREKQFPFQVLTCHFPFYNWGWPEDFIFCATMLIRLISKLQNF